MVTFTGNAQGYPVFTCKNRFKFLRNYIGDSSPTDKMAINLSVLTKILTSLICY